jgi:hypothetical protein
VSSVGKLLRDGQRCDRSGPLWTEFLAFHEANRWIYGRLNEICSQLLARGFRRYSTRTLISVLRFEADLKTTGEQVQIEGESRAVKLNDHHSPYYARMLIEDRPELWDFFELRSAEGDPEEQPDEPDPPPKPEWARQIGGQGALW